MAQGDTLVRNQNKTKLLTLLAARTLKVALCHGSVPSIDGTVVLGDLTQITAANYSSGGAALASMSVTQEDTPNDAYLDAANLTWTLLGAPSRTLDFAALYDDTDATKTVLQTWVLITQPNGGDYTLVWNASGLQVVA
jgi:hypothetical protein